MAESGSYAFKRWIRNADVRFPKPAAYALDII